MGLGKTVITLTALNELMLDELEFSRVLIIAPLRVARDTWPAELSKWEHLRFLDASLIIGNEKERISAINTAKMIYIIN
ncbi:MAG: ATP-dependent helicase, partial [Synergistaceae bacterium]|nr:ATP-dependent helicase [Synergistaceae bacterium]